MKPLETSSASALYEALRSKADLRYSHRYRSDIAIVVSVGLQLNPTLLRLNLWHNSIGTSGAAAIAAALRVNSSLLSLSLSYNQIGDSGVAAFAEALKVNWS
jgi:hypothetical protein